MENYPIDASTYSPLCALAPPSTLETLSLKDGQQVYIQRQSPPVLDLTREIKHYQGSSNSTSKVSARIKLKDRITATPMNQAEEESKPQLSTYSIFATDLLPRNQIVLLGSPNIRSWDLARVSIKPPQTSTGIELPSQELNIPFLLPLAMKNLNFVGVDSIVSECTRFFQHSLLAQKTLLGGSNASQLLLCGGKGSGKTGIATTVAARLEKDPQLCICPLYIDMSRYSEEALAGILRLAIWCKPTILILDNVHYFVGVETEHTESSKSTRIAELFVKFLYSLRAHSASVLAIAEGTSSLNKIVSTGHTFSKVINIKTPDKSARATILKQFVEIADAPPTRGLNYVSLATKTEGYSAQDLKDFTDRALHKATIRTADANVPEVSLEMCDFDAAQEGFTPLSLRDVKLQKSEVEWADIGGLQETRRILCETLEWPTKYAAIFAKCPLRLRSGLLLYGYPGCGKTLLASAVSKECGLNFISVKGPELLNKYIGASEKSVRELFERASAAKPCVLFFDEFDSIAPRRGHDSTGVTDRVVNQMLTQMDGAEGLDGVYVLAATSRPDLIDPALLRPGRLDKSLLCHMPTQLERKEILQAIARKMHVDSSVDFEHIAASTEGYSGADLQALVYNAHLESVHDAFSGTTPVDAVETKTPEFVILNGAKGVSKAENSAIAARIATVIRSSNPSKVVVVRTGSKPPTITVRHIRKALSTTRPSVPEVERRRLERIYHEFSSDRSEPLPQPPEADSRSVGNRVSLM
ncbi:Peroxisome biogenesis factor 1 AltName: Full=Peroxin-1 [Serendipita indica DSM 11827]|nr:Peroxisome biogenesis factor 1 AltName: Full=Peroxin-1 [Serendipita indica DSM 11827]